MTGEKLLSNLSRFVVIVWLFIVLILTSSYTATLTSMMTVRHIELNLKDNYIGYQGGSFATKEGVINNLNFKNSNLHPFNSPEEYANALSRGSKKGGVSAIIDEVPYLKIFLAKYPKDYSMIGPISLITNGFGFVSIISFKDLLIHHIQTLVLLFLIAAKFSGFP